MDRKTIRTVALWVYLGLVHRDLGMAERWADHARNYLNQDVVSGRENAGTDIRRPY